MPNVIRRSLRDDRRALIGWTLGILTWIMVYVGMYPQFKKGLVDAKMQAMPPAMRQFMGLRDWGSAAGYLEMTVYSLLGPLLLIMIGVILGTRAIAGPEENHTLELMLANPVSRTRFLLARFAAFAVETVALGAIPWIMITLLSRSYGMHLTSGRIAAASLSLLLMALTFGAFALAAGAVTGRRAVALATGGGLGVAAYVAYGLANQVASLSWLRWLTPFHYYIGNDPLRTGLHPNAVFVPLALTAIAAVVAIVGFERRDLAA